VVAMSGGVDSSVAAHLLLEQGHEVFGAFMWRGSRAPAGGRAADREEESRDARLVAQHLER